MSEFSLDNVNSMYMDVLKEIGNIGAGNATTAIAGMLGTTMKMEVPRVLLMDATKLGDAICPEEETIVGIFLEVTNDISGSMMFLMKLPAAHFLVNKLMGRPQDYNEPFDEMIEFVRNSTAEGFGGLVATSENYATDANAMRAMMEQFAQTAEELRSTMDGIRESISAVNIAVEESAKGIAGVSESSVQLTGNVNDIQSEASDNNGIAEDLATEVGKFKLE